MITKFKYFSGIINVDGKHFKLYYNENIMPFEIDLYIKGNIYDNLSIIIPDSKKLRRKEFFLNPNIDYNIVEALKKENFIQETDMISIAGDKETKSYILNI